jgi:hypothetical protein
MMDQGQIFVANLSKGKLGEDKSNLLGAFLVAQFQMAAMSRADVSVEHRRDFRLFVDEFQSFGTDAFASILSEARKYRLSLTLSHQYIDQLLPEVRSAVFGNVGSLVSFRVGETDAEVLEREFGHSYPASSFSHLGNHQILTKLLVHGTQHEPFLATTLPPSGTHHGRRERIIGRCRERLATQRKVVEERIRKWLER